MITQAIFCDFFDAIYERFHMASVNLRRISWQFPVATIDLNRVPSYCNRYLKTDFCITVETGVDPRLT